MTSSWGRGDLYTLAIALPVFVAGCVLHRKAIKQSTNHDVIVSLMGNSLACGPMLMIILDPAIKMFSDVDLLTTVMEEARITLWFASFMAFVSTALSIMRQKSS